MVVRVLDHLEHCVTQEDGMIIYSIIFPIIKRGDSVTVSFEGVSGVPTSFVNAAFIELLRDIPFSVIKQKLSISQSNRQINELIKKRIYFESQRDRNPCHGLC